MFNKQFFYFKAVVCPDKVKDISKRKILPHKANNSNNFYEEPNVFHVQKFTNNKFVQKTA